MSERDYMDEWYRKMMEEQSFDQGADIWDRLEGSLDSDYMDQWYRKKIDMLSLAPGADVWDHLEDSLDMDTVWDNLDDSLDVDQVWGRLDDSLDIDEVWTRLDASLNDRGRRGLYYRWFGGAAAAILALMVVGAAVFQPWKTDHPSFNGISSITEIHPDWGNGDLPVNKENKRTPDSEELIPRVNPLENNAPSVNSFAAENPKKDFNPNGTPNGKQDLKIASGKDRIKNEQQNPKKQLKASFAMTTEKAGSPEQSPEEKSSPNSYVPGKIEQLRENRRVEFIAAQRVKWQKDELPLTKPIANPDALLEGMEQDREAWAMVDPNERKMPDNNFFVGGTMGVKNQWLLAHDTYAGFKKTELQTAELDFSGTVGLNAGMMISEKVGLQTDYVFLSNSGQKYIDYTNGRSVNRELDFSYQSLMVATRLRRKEWQWFNSPVADHFNLGLYGGVLTGAQEQVAGKTTLDIENAYRSWDFGLSVGYGVDVLSKSGVMAGFGLRLHQGLVNTYEGTAVLPSSLNPTYNSSVDFIFNLRYAFRKK